MACSPSTLLTLLTLPSDVFQGVLAHLYDDYNAMHALAASHPRFAKEAARFRENFALPGLLPGTKWSTYPREELLCTSKSNGSDDATALKVAKSSSPGHAQFILETPLKIFNVYWTVRLTRFVGRTLEIGVARHHRDYAVISESAVRFDCAGRLLVGAKRLGFGRVFQQGDVLTVIYLASSRSILFLDEDTAMGPPIDLTGLLKGREITLRLYVRFGNIAGECVTVYGYKAKFIGDFENSHQHWTQPTTLPPTHGCVVVVTWKDDEWYAVPLDPNIATLDNLRSEIGTRSGLDPNAFELIINNTRLVAGQATLAELGIQIDPKTGSQRRDILMSVPHLVS